MWMEFLERTEVTVCKSRKCPPASPHRVPALRPEDQLLFHLCQLLHLHRQEEQRRQVIRDKTAMSPNGPVSPLLSRD